MRGQEWVPNGLDPTTGAGNRKKITTPPPLFFVANITGMWDSLIKIKISESSDFFLDELNQTHNAFNFKTK